VFNRPTQSAIVNPYIVLADILLGICFVFVCLYVGYLGSEEVVFKSDRFKKQDQLENALAQYLSDVYGQQVRKIEIGKSSGKGQDASFSKEFLYSNADGKVLARVQRNSNLQRIQLFEVSFRPGSSDPLPDSIPVYEAAMKAIGDSRNILLYLFFHGITEAPEREAVAALGYGFVLPAAGSSAEQIALAQSKWDQHCLLLSQNRATKVKMELEKRGYISAQGMSLREARTQGLLPSMMAPTYGTGSMLYTRGQAAGRVDIVLFYPERSSDLASKD
jgi:hypothetical protein